MISEVEHSDATVAALCPICNPQKSAAKKVRGKAFYEHLYQYWEKMGEDRVFTPEERAGFFDVVKLFLTSEGLL